MRHCRLFDDVGFNKITNKYFKTYKIPSYCNILTLLKKRWRFRFLSFFSAIKDNKMERIRKVLVDVSRVMATVARDPSMYTTP